MTYLLVAGGAVGWPSRARPAILVSLLAFRFSFSYIVAVVIAQLFPQNHDHLKSYSVLAPSRHHQHPYIYSLFSLLSANSYSSGPLFSLYLIIFFPLVLSLSPIFYLFSYLIPSGVVLAY